MSEQTRFPRFFVTAEAPCPYLPDRLERKVFTELRGPDAVAVNESLGRIGFRRSQNVAYRPNCVQCAACVSVRVQALQFSPNRSQARLLRKNSDLIVEACQPWATEEQYRLLQSYLKERHPDGGMVAMDGFDYTDMVETSPVNTVIVEYRDPDDGRLVGACLTDKQSDGLSMVYSFYETGPQARKGLGSFIILDHITRTAKVGLDYVYLGYWVEGSANMDYKRQYKPLEKLGVDGWMAFTD